MQRLTTSHFSADSIHSERSEDILINPRLAGCYFYIIAEYRAASFDYLRRWVRARRALRRIESTAVIPRERGA